MRLMCRNDNTTQWNFFAPFYPAWVKGCALNYVLHLFCSARVRDVEKACASGMCHASCQMVRVSRMAAWWMMSYVEIRSHQWMETQTSSCRSPVLYPAQVRSFNSETGQIQTCEAVFIKCVQTLNGKTKPCYFKGWLFLQWHCYSINFISLKINACFLADLNGLLKLSQQKKELKDTTKPW